MTMSSVNTVADRILMVKMLVIKIMMLKMSMVRIGLNEPVDEDKP